LGAALKKDERLGISSQKSKHDQWIKEWIDSWITLGFHHIYIYIIC
jgi:methylmalonyl-CoA mutase cobalamin-binding subunit